MRLIVKILLTSFVLFLFGGSVDAQTWAQRLSKAERDYEEGRLTNIPRLLEEGLKLKAKEGGFTHEERIRAYKLITKVYIFIDDEPQAEDALIKLVKEDKEHKLNPLSDPAELYFLYEKFRTLPILRVAVRGGSNKSVPNVLRSFSPANTLNVTKIYNGNDVKNKPPGSASTAGTLGVSFWGEAMAERRLKWGLEVGTGINFRGSRYDVDSYIGENAPSGDNETGDPTLQTFVAQSQSMLRFPVYIRYNYINSTNTGPIPYISLGLSYDYLLNAQYIEATRRGGTAFSLAFNQNLRDLDLVNNSNMSATVALGVKLRLQTHFVTVEARYDRGLFNYINADARWNGNQPLTYDLGYVEDDLALDVISISLGYTYSVYSPKKLKSFR